MSPGRTAAGLLVAAATIGGFVQLGAAWPALAAVGALVVGTTVAVASRPPSVDRAPSGLRRAAEGGLALLLLALVSGGAGYLVITEGSPFVVSLLAIAATTRFAYGRSALVSGLGFAVATVGAPTLAAWELWQEGSSSLQVVGAAGTLAAVALAVVAPPVPVRVRRPAPSSSVPEPPLATGWFEVPELGSSVTEPGDSVTLAAGIAHDFNNLLTSILGNAHVALAELREGSPIRRAVLEIEEAGRRAKELVAQLLAFSGTGRLDVRALQLESIVTQAVTEAQASLPPELRIEVVHGTGPLIVEADPSHLRQAVLDLLLNAIDAMEGLSGTIRLTSGIDMMTREDLESLVLGDRLEPGPFVWFDVVDEGTGIDGDIAHRVFDPFFSTKPGGSGLGLAALYGVVRDHLGALRIHTRPGRGTSFRVWLPSAHEQDQRRALPHPGDHRLGIQSGTILVAEDEDLVRRAVTRMLSRLGFEVVATADGHDAIRAFVESPEEFRLAFLDIRMPDIDGFEVLERIREVRPDIPAILCTGFSGADDQPSVEDVHFLRKPFSLTALVEAVNGALGQPVTVLPAPPEEAEPP